jgi:hypothetical protein
MPPPNADPAARWDKGGVSRGRPDIRIVDMLIVLVITAGGVIAAQWLVYDLAMSLELVWAMLLLQSSILLAAVYIVIVRARGVAWHEIGVRSAQGVWYSRAVVIALCTVPLVSGTNLFVQWLVGAPIRNPQIQLLAPAEFSWSAFLGTLVVAGIVAPIAEEIVFRGLLYGWLRRYLSATIAVVASAIVFGLAHGIFVLAPALAVQGAILAVVYERSNSLWPPIILHGTFNVTMVAALYAALAAGIPLQ